MLVFLTAAALIITFSVSAFGWGRLTAIFLYKNRINSIAFEVALGLSVWVFIGGILNALSLANGTALSILFLLGILFFALNAYSRLRIRKTASKQRLLENFRELQQKIRAGNMLPEYLPVLLVIIASSFFIITILPSHAFNNNDDYYTYFPRIFRMLHTGRLGDTLSFDFLGFDSFGAHQFLQSFLLNYFPVNYINGFDAIFCFLLCGLLLNDIGKRYMCHWLLRAGAITILILIQPQYVNTSALYSGSLMILALVYSSLLLLQTLEKQKTNTMFGAAVIYAFIASSLTALKHTFIPFAVSYSVLFFLMLILITRKRRRALLAAGISAPVAGIMLAPWFLTVPDKIIFFFNRNISSLLNLLKITDRGISSPENTAAGSSLLSASSSDLTGTSSVISDLFSSQKLFYGGNASDYGFVVLCSLGAAVWAFYRFMRRQNDVRRDNLIPVSSLGISLFITYLISGYFAENFEIGIRYSCPIIIAAFPALALMFSENSVFSENLSTSNDSRIKQGTVLLAMGICIGLFLTGWYARANQLIEYRSMLSYPLGKNANYLAYQKMILSESGRREILAMQEKTEKGAGILAWHESSFFLDFKRNKIAGISTPVFLRRSSGLSFSDFSDAEKLVNYLRSIGIRYVIWSYQDDYPKQNNSGTRELEEGIYTLTNTSMIIHNDGKKLVIDING